MLKMKDYGINKVTNLVFSGKLSRVTAKDAVNRKSTQNRAMPCGVERSQEFPLCPHLRLQSSRNYLLYIFTGISPGFPVWPPCHGLNQFPPCPREGLHYSPVHFPAGEKQRRMASQEQEG